ncbi:hypothetical protein E2C01_009290 [Portunus trituberculatus]|uniref:Uncharacterized protein n=1 Tax=Portunus trituberculatus TaxID=210409 RepID=A0A5B7D5F7_PORTR|nr:hypothetical protein [Portunus trituberculatus]
MLFCPVTRRSTLGFNTCATSRSRQQLTEGGREVHTRGGGELQARIKDEVSAAHTHRKIHHNIQQDECGRSSRGA